MNRIRAVFLDVDGTLIGPGQREIPEETRRAMAAAQARGIKICLSTGRHPNEARVITDTYPFDALITCNGQLCYVGNQCIRRAPMSDADVDFGLMAALREGFALTVSEEGGQFASCYTDPFLDVFHQVGIDPPPVRDPRAPRGSVYQMNFYLTAEREAEILKGMPGAKSRRWHPLYSDVMPAAGGKDAGVRAVLSHFHLTPDAAMAIGDGENDVDMFSAVGCPVAMGNASSFVKARAKYVTSVYNERGVADAIEEHAL